MFVMLGVGIPFDVLDGYISSHRNRVVLGLAKQKGTVVTGM